MMLKSGCKTKREGKKMTLFNLKQKLFNRKLKNLKTITFKKDGFNCVGEKTVVDFTDNRVKFFDWTTDESYEYEKIFDKEYFLSELSLLNVGSWENFYTPKTANKKVLDGEYWSLDFEFDNGKKKSFGGYSEYPYNFKKLLQLI